MSIFDRAIAAWLGIAVRPGLFDSVTAWAPSSPIGSRDRRLSGKARRRARRARQQP